MLRRGPRCLPSGGSEGRGEAGRMLLDLGEASPQSGEKSRPLPRSTAPYAYADMTTVRGHVDAGPGNCL